MLSTNTITKHNRAKQRYCAPVNVTGSSSSPGVKLCFVTIQRHTARRTESVKRTARLNNITSAEKMMQQSAKVLTCFASVYAFSIFLIFLKVYILYILRALRVTIFNKSVHVVIKVLFFFFEYIKYTILFKVLHFINSYKLAEFFRIGTIKRK